MTLFDTSVIIDARDLDSPWNRWAQERIAEAVAGDGAAVNTVVLAEASVRTPSPADVPAQLHAVGITLLPLPVAAAVPAAVAFAAYLERLKNEGKNAGNKVPLPDFLIGAHAAVAGMRLVTRDPARVKTYFPLVQLITP